MGSIYIYTKVTYKPIYYSRKYLPSYYSDNDLAKAERAIWFEPLIICLKTKAICFSAEQLPTSYLSK